MQLLAPEPILTELGLIADPHEDTRKLYRSLLEPFVGDFDEAEDGAEALAKAIQRRPGLLVTEARLPRIDGCTLCSLLRNDPVTRGISIVVVTASVFQAEIERARRAGADHVVTKPCTPELLRERARQLLLESLQLRQGSARVPVPIPEQLRRSQELLARAERTQRRIIWRSQCRETTTTPPIPPPVLRCPTCDEMLIYVHSHVGGVSPKLSEQWDHLNCRACGDFQYRHRTRKLRRL